jgi:hypothetical protein
LLCERVSDELTDTAVADDDHVALRGKGGSGISPAVDEPPNRPGSTEEALLAAGQRAEAASGLRQMVAAAARITL